MGRRGRDRRWKGNKWTPSALAPDLALYSVTPDTAVGVAGDWNCLHDGTGCTVVIKCAAVVGFGGGGLFSTKGYTNSHIGVLLDIDSTVPDMEVEVGATAGVFYYRDVPTPTTPGNVYTYRYEESRSPAEFDVRKDGTQVSAGDSTAAPTASNSTSELRIGSINGGAIFVGTISHFYIWRRTLPDVELQQVERFLV